MNSTLYVGWTLLSSVIMVFALICRSSHGSSQSNTFIGNADSIKVKIWQRGNDVTLLPDEVVKSF